MSFRPVLICVMLWIGDSVRAQSATDAAGGASGGGEYAAVAASRAAKIVAALGLADAAQSERVTAIVANQYVRLHGIHGAREARLAALKAESERLAQGSASDSSRASVEAAVAEERRRIGDEMTARLYELHAAYLACLAVELTPSQVEQIKDGMTYGVLPNTWRAYQEMLPQMTEEERRRVLAWLIEAREHAMDAGSAEEKHSWFGKYKGRITNYLAAAGYDLKAAEKAWLETRKR